MSSIAVASLADGIESTRSVEDGIDSTWPEESFLHQHTGSYRETHMIRSEE